MRIFLSTVILLAISALLIFAVAEMPAFGEGAALAHEGIMPKFVREAQFDTGANNVIAAIILDYRAYDTLGEATVLFVAVVAVSAMLTKGHIK
jgi:multisubunit Na+/H+ antiporter MnhB subunit